MKNDKLKKHHFWILLGIVPLFVLIAVLVVTSSVGGAIDTRLAAINASKKSLDGKNPKPEALLSKLDVTIDEVKKKKGGLWKDNWERQKDLYVWPKNSEKLQRIEAMHLKFGAKIPDDDFTYDQFKNKEVYISEFSTADSKTNRIPGMADTIAPTQFNGGWEAILRHVNANGWGNGVLTSEQIWLIMEDIWVQRSMLAAVRSVNDQMAEFRRVKYVKDGVVVDNPADKNTQDPLRRRFESRTWAVELEVKDRENKKVLTGRLINTTNRLQLMGVGNTMVLKVWLEPGQEALPFELRIGGEFLPGVGATKNIKDKEGKEVTLPANVIDIETAEIQAGDHIIPASLSVAEIARVEQVFDARTVPIRRIEALALGFRDSRHIASALEMPNFEVWKKEKDAAAAAAADASSGAATSGAGGGTSLSGPPPSSLGGKPGMVGAGGLGAGGSSSGAMPWGGGTLESVINGNKKRYITVTDEVRRLPVAIVVVVDQSQMQDVELAFANSPLRFQITQVTWKRFRGQLAGLGTGGGSTGGAGDVVDAGRGDTSSDFTPGSNGFKRPGSFGAPGGGSSIGRPPGPIGSSGPGPIGSSGPGPMSGGPGYPGYGGSSGTLTTVSESQLTSGLIELSIYGVISLYEQFPTPGASTEAPKDGTPTTPKDPKDKGQLPQDPMITDPKTPKKRRRVR